MASANQTKDHELIRRWAEERGGIPTIVKGTGGLLRIDFIKGPKSHGREASLAETSWDEWFQIFDDNDLTFLFSPEKDSKFFKLISEETARESKAEEVGGAREQAGRKRERGGEQRVRVVFEEEGEWAVQLEGSDRRHTYRTKEEAVHHARELAHRNEPCELIIERSDGGTEEHLHYGEHAGA